MKSIALPSASSLARALWSRKAADAARTFASDAIRAARTGLNQLGPARRAALVAGTTAVAAAGIAYAALDSKSVDPARAGLSNSVTLTEPPPLLLRDLKPEDAMSLNRTIPFARGPNPPARACDAAAEERAGGRALHCLTAAGV